MKNVKTLGQFILETDSDADGELSRLLLGLSIAARMVNRAINKAALIDIIGDAGTKNVNGEKQKKIRHVCQ